jgi:death-on-curing protein
MELDFLRVDDVLQVHADQILRYGGDDGVRDPGLLASAVEVARASFEGQRLHEDLFSIAAAYLFHIVQNHPFVDGNKRTGAAAAILFLDLHGVSIEADDVTLAEHVLAVAQGRVDKAAIAEFLRRHASTSP